VHEDSTTSGQDVELDEIKLVDGASFSPNTAKSPGYFTGPDTPGYPSPGTSGDKVSIMGHDHRHVEDLEQKAGIHITVLGKR
jgi:hypothetical protein